MSYVYNVKEIMPVRCRANFDIQVLNDRGEQLWRGSGTIERDRQSGGKPEFVGDAHIQHLYVTKMRQKAPGTYFSIEFREPTLRKAKNRMIREIGTALIPLVERQEGQDIEFSEPWAPAPRALEPPNPDSIRNRGVEFPPYPPGMGPPEEDKTEKSRRLNTLGPGNARADDPGPDWDSPYNTGNPQVRGEPAVGWLPRAGFVGQTILTPKMAEAKMGGSVEEDAKKLYRRVLEETDDWNSWGVYELFPDANSHQALAAAKYVVGQMRENYAEQYEPEWWWLIEERLRPMVLANLI